MIETSSPVPRLYYVCGPLGSSDGAQIFDSKLLSSLKKDGVSLSTQHPIRRRSLRLPLWQGKMCGLDSIITQLRKVRQQGEAILISHERYFGIAHSIPVDMLIVHNYLPCFHFPGRRLLELYYRLGSQSFMVRAFRNAKAIVFLSYRDQRHALADFPEIADRTYVLPPPPYRAQLSRRRDNVIHMSGSENWLPKRLSRLTVDEHACIAAAGFEIEDFGPHYASAFGLIPDRFTVGFKLKLMQMLYQGDAIASLSDIRDEMMVLAADYPWWCEVESVEEAVEWFTFLRKDPAWRAHRADTRGAKLPDWDSTAVQIERILSVDV